jgi:hypothetical protein
MFIPFENMPDHARLWIYQANRNLSEVEEKAVFQLGQVFISRWSTHGQPLNASLKIYYQRFIIIAVDEQHTQASGCSVDSSVAFVKEIENKFNTPGQPLHLFDRTLVAFKGEDGIRMLSLAEAKKQIAEGSIPAEAPTFNNLINTKAQLDTDWIIPVKNPWLGKYLQQQNA